MESRIKIMVFEPGREAYVEWIKNIEEAYKSVVEGDVRSQRLDGKSVVVSNADTKSPVLKANRQLGGEIICGTFFIASEGENGCYASISDECMRYYYNRYNKPEKFSKKDVVENRIYGLKAIGNNEVFVNNLNLKLRTLDSENMPETKEMLELMHEVFCSTYGTACVDDIDAGSEDMFYLPAVIKSRETDAVCIGLVLVDIEASGEHWETQFMLGGNFYHDNDENMPDEIKTEREKIGVYDYWYTPDYYGDIHSDKNAAPKEILEMLEYACDIDSVKSVNEEDKCRNNEDYAQNNYGITGM